MENVAKGDRNRFYSLLEYYEKKLERYDGDIKRLINDEYWKISDGLACALLHAMIQLGYGVEANCGKIVCEGFAYHYHSFYSPYIHSKRQEDFPGVGTCSITFSPIVSLFCVY